MENLEPMSVDEMIEVLKAFKKGEFIEQTPLNESSVLCGIWTAKDTYLSFNFEDYRYRVAKGGEG